MVGGGWVDHAPPRLEAQLKLERMQQKAEQEQARLEAQKKAEKVRVSGGLGFRNTWTKNTWFFIFGMKTAGG